MKKLLFSWLTLSAVANANPTPPDGAQLFTTNCAACHMLDQMVVGPSLVEIRTHYQGKKADFVKWCVAPQKKRENVIDMPSMVHVGTPGLEAIYEHIMKTAEGVRAKKQAAGDPYAASPLHNARPYVQRIFLPNASPASIAVALDANNSLCWDAGECRLRYAWTGGFIDGFPYWRGNGSSVAAILGTVRYVEEKPPFGTDKQMKFLGYTLKDKLPVFRYKVGDLTVTEQFLPLKAGSGFQRAFSVSPAPSASLTMEFTAREGVTIASDKGTLTGSKLTLAPADAASFSLTFTLP
jgi:cytochrome c551/c552